MVRDLLLSPIITFKHRFACHVWQRVFETKWTDHYNILEIVQIQLKDLWAQIANDENGSLVVQCIFDHCGVADKRWIIDEIFQCTLAISCGQWGNWVIQHLLVNGTKAHQDTIMAVVLENAYTMSIDQYASKVVEKCVKLSAKEQIAKFISILLTSSPTSYSPF